MNKWDKNIALIGFALLSWIYAWIPALWCGLDIYNNDVIPPNIQIPTNIVPLTEISTQLIALYGMTQNTNIPTSALYLIQGIAFPLWTITFLAFKSKGWSMALAFITLICALGMMIMTDANWLWFVPLMLHKGYDIYWTHFAEFKD